MVRHRSAVRQWRRSLRRNDINRKNRSEIKTQIKRLRQAIQENNKEEALKLLPETYSIIDRGIKKGAIHENQGARYKARLTRQVEMIKPSPSL